MHVNSDCSRTFFVCETKESNSRGIAKPLLLLNITDKSYVSMGLMYRPENHFLWQYFSKSRVLLTSCLESEAKFVNESL